MTDPDTLPDTSAIISHLDTLWLDNPPTCYDGRALRPLLGSEHDQQPVPAHPYWDIVRRLPLPSWSSGRGHAVEVDGFRLIRPGDGNITRDRLVHTFAWAIPTPGDIAWIASRLDGRPLVEIGAGTGYWAAQLARAGVDVVAFDKEPGGNHWCADVQYHPVHEAGHDAAGDHPGHALMLCWPPYSRPVAADALRAYAGDLLIYIGEPHGGCTADDDFFDALDRDWSLIGRSPHHVTYAGIHCYVEAYRREAPARPTG